jgi:subtilase family serine protease
MRENAMKTVNFQRIAGSVLIALIVWSVSLATIGYVQASPMKSQPHVQSLGGTLPCLTSPTKLQCYSPQQLWNAYDVTPLLKAGVTGKGRTIVLISNTASQQAIQHDLHLYDQFFGLKDAQVNVMMPFGMSPPINGANILTSWNVQVAHSMAPDATIDVVVTGDTTKDRTPESFFFDLLKAAKYAVDQNLGDVIALTYNLNQTVDAHCFDRAYYQYQHTILQEARAKHISVLIGAGEIGAVARTCTSPNNGLARNPIKGIGGLDDPLLTVVGGTTLHASVGQGTYQSETTWNEGSAFGATGGGFSSIFPRPAYQSGATGNRYRGVPDVAWVAEGVPTVTTFEGSSYIYPMDGTSIGVSSWAGLVVLFDQYAGHRLGFLNEGLYRILQNKYSYSQGFHDITTGNNTIQFETSSGKVITVTGYNAGPGWDAVTGLGTPKVAALAPLLKQFVHDNDGNNL